MKKLLFLCVLVALVSLVFIGCELFASEETYSYSVAGICIAVTTSDKDMKDALDLSGYEIGTCPTTGILGTCEDYAEILDTSVDASFYEELGDASVAETTCSLIGGTWVAD